MSDADESPEGAHFQSLYRRFRPQKFAEVRGQSHVTMALRNAVRESRVAHAYLFSGPRGTGKTSTARILGKALNCTNLLDGEPCGVCDSCRSIASGNSFDVHELDAASNNGVDAMRDLVSRASLATPGRWKVYIVDEVHMLSTAASNALLKTLEEPPDHVVFVLATTDPQKVIPTIRSRTQQYEFHLMADDVLAELVGDIAKSAGLALPEGAANQAVRRGRGSARDTLSILDQVAAAGVVEDDTQDLARVIAAIAEEDGPGALTALDGAVRQGRDPQQIAVDLVEQLRAGFLTLAGAVSVAEGVARLTPGELEVLRSLGLPRCVRGMELIGTAIVAMRDAPEPRITLEIAVYRAASLDGDSSVDALIERIERLERRIETISSGAASATSPPPPPPPPPPPRQALEESAPTPPAESRPESPREPENPAPPLSPRRAAPSPRAEPPPAPTRMAEPPASPPMTSSETGEAPPASVGSRPALGAYRNRTAGGAPDSAPQRPAEPAAAATTDRPNVSTPTGDGVETPSATGDRGAMPDRDAFVLAWGDTVLTSLRPRTRMLYNVGHFIAAENGVGDFALPNDFHIQMAEPHRVEVEEALSAHFGVKVQIRLVLERGGRPPASARPVEGPDGRERPDNAGPPVEERVSLDDVGEPIGDDEVPIATGTEWATDKILEAFPGAQEVPE